MRTLGAQMSVSSPRSFVHECLHPARLARAAVLVAAVVSGSLLVSPAPAAVAATVICWLAAFGALAATTSAPQQLQAVNDDQSAWWPTTLRAVLTGLILTLAVLGASRALLDGSWEELLASAVLTASVVPWWLIQTDHSSAAQERRHPTRDEAHIRLWQSRRRVDAATFAATVGLSGSLVSMALSVVLSEVVAGGPAHLLGGSGCGVTSATFAPGAAIVSALAAVTATAAATLSAHVRPTPRADLRHLAAWCALGATLGVTLTLALALWWSC